MSRNLTEQWATSKQSATLLHVVRRFPDDFNKKVGGYSEVEDLDKHEVYCSLNSGDLMQINPGGYKYCWTPGHKRVYLLASYLGLATEGGLHEPFQPNVYTLRDLTQQGEFGQTEFNRETLTNFTYTDLPQAHLVRMLPLHSPDGPIETSVLIFVKCFSTVYVKKREAGWISVNRR